MRRYSCIVLMCLLAAAATAQVVHLPYFPFYGNPDSLLGFSVSGAGDVNGDGFDDVIVGSRGDLIKGADTDSARVFSGATGVVLYVFFGDSGYDLFGWSVSGAGDVNGDGFDDLIVGAPYDDNSGPYSGSARVFSGATGALLYTFSGDSIDDSFGWSVSGAGDVNNDGFDDLIIGAFGNDSNGSDSGSARVLSGATGAILYTFHGDSEGDAFGWSVSGAGDVNNDGFDDLIVGAPNNSDNGYRSGNARVFSGASGAVLYTFIGESGEFGTSVSGAGDVNGDGFDDMIIGARFDNANGNSSGSARVFCGATGAILYTFNGDSAGDTFGQSVGGAGDVNSDGFDDLIVGAHRDDNNGNSSGSARVFCGATGAILYTFNGDGPRDEFGRSVSAAGDVNGDGFDDLLVGAHFDDNNGINAGSARIFFSCALPTSPKPCPGDVDGDGDSDFADLNQVISNFNTSCAP